MSTTAKFAEPRILVVRLGAMGDILHTLPAAATLKHNYPNGHLTWVVESRWRPLLEGNPYVDRIVEFRRRTARGVKETFRELRGEEYDLAVDFQGLIKSAVIAKLASPRHIIGYHRSQVRERLSALFYSERVAATAVHVVDRHLELAAAAGAVEAVRVFPLPEGRAEDPLPANDFVLASPLAGWGAKQWPAEYFEVLGELLLRELGMPLVLDRGPGSLAGLIYATRRATAVVGVDSGPMHLAAALNKPGVAIFGPTDPARNGPCGRSMTVLRSKSAVTTYKRTSEIAASMRAVTPDQVFACLKAQLKIGSPVE